MHGPSPRRTQARKSAAETASGTRGGERPNVTTNRAKSTEPSGKSWGACPPRATEVAVGLSGPSAGEPAAVAAALGGLLGLGLSRQSQRWSTGTPARASSMHAAAGPRRALALGAGHSRTHELGISECGKEDGRPPVVGGPAVRASNIRRGFAPVRREPRARSAPLVLRLLPQELDRPLPRLLRRREIGARAFALLAQEAVAGARSRGASRTAAGGPRARASPARRSPRRARRPRRRRARARAARAAAATRCRARCRSTRPRRRAWAARPRSRSWSSRPSRSRPTRSARSRRAARRPAPHERETRLRVSGFSERTSFTASSRPASDSVPPPFGPSPTAGRARPR